MEGIITPPSSHHNKITLPLSQSRCSNSLKCLAMHTHSSRICHPCSRMILTHSLKKWRHLVEVVVPMLPWRLLSIISKMSWQSLTMNWNQLRMVCLQWRSLRKRRSHSSRPTLHRMASQLTICTITRSRCGPISTIRHPFLIRGTTLCPKPR